MDERAALRMLATELPEAGDDAAVVGNQVLTTDMLHETTDFPDGTTRYTAGWRAIGASLSDVAAMGGNATAAVAVYAVPEFIEADLRDFVSGAADVCQAVDAEYVGGDLDSHQEFTVATTALGETDTPVYRSGATAGDLVCVTGTLGRSAAGFEEFQRGNVERGNDLFRFVPRVQAGTALREYATAMLDSSDGLARSLHQLAEASNCGFDIDWADVPIDESVDAVATSEAERRELAAFFGEDFELVFTLPEAALAPAREAVSDPITVIGTVTEADVLAGGEPLPDRGFTH